MTKCTLIFLLALACASALKTPINKCMTVIHGISEGHVTRLDDLKLESRTKSWKFTLNYGCERGIHVGTLLSVCDYKVPPKVEMTSLLQGTIHRRGHPHTEGAVHTYVFCQTLEDDESPGQGKYGGYPEVISADPTRSKLFQGHRK